MKITTWKRPAVAMLVLGLAGAACTSDDAPQPEASGSETEASTELVGTRAEVVARGVVRCGVSGKQPGFSVADGDGTMQGLDADVCRAIAAAVLGDATAVDFVEVTDQGQFTSLAAETIDVLLGVPVTATADGVEAVTFSRPTFYDGQGVMVLETSEIQGLAELEGLTVCGLAGAPGDDNGAAALTARGIQITPLPFPDANRLLPAFESGECEAATAYRSQLVAMRDDANNAIRILGDTISRRPLAAGTREVDAQWSQIVDWTIQGLLLAEEMGISSSNLATFLDDPSAEAERLLGIASEGGNIFDAGLGLPEEWLQDVIAQVGNYAEIYTRNLGANTAVGLARAGTVNELWNRGGLHYPWPYR